MHGIMQIFTDRTQAALEIGLTGEAQRQRVTSNNIANVNTPGFTAQKVDFEGSLARALRNRDGGPVSIAHSAGEPWMSLNGNKVSLENETTTLVKSNLHYEAIVNAVNGRFGLLGTAIGVR
ncbi:MAG: flagellar basal body rod protein FlgB [Acidimicrobiales bacterium]